MPRFYCPTPLAAGSPLDLPAGTARHVQVLRLQPGTGLTLFNGEGGEFDAVIERMGRSEVRVQVLRHVRVEREANRQVHLAVGMPANERMDWLVEKAAELGAASIQPLLAERSVLKLSGERAQKKRAHWQAIAIAACEQCGRNRIPDVAQIVSFDEWVVSDDVSADTAILDADASRSLAARAAATPPRSVAIGPEGGFTREEIERAQMRGAVAVHLGRRVLRAETAAVATLATLGAIAGDAR
jgi:16S rRNA (uracil1498-N3)-methyltransferase